MADPGASQGKRPQAPQTPVPTSVSLSHADLQHLINVAVQQATQRNTQAPQAAPIVATAAAAPAVPAVKSIKLAEQNEFTGKPEDLQDFLSNCELVFMVQAEVYPRNASNRKIAYALSLMKKGSAARWKVQYIRSNFSRGVLTDSWNMFKDKLSHAFPDVGQAQNAMKMLGTMKQGSQTIEAFNTKFLIQGQKAGMDFGDTITMTHAQNDFEVPNLHAATLIHLYQNALNPKIAAQIIVNHPPDTINEWMS